MTAHFKNQNEIFQLTRDILSSSMSLVHETKHKKAQPTPSPPKKTKTNQNSLLRSAHKQLQVIRHQILNIQVHVS